MRLPPSSARVHSCVRSLPAALCAFFLFLSSALTAQTPRVTLPTLAPDALASLTDAGPIPSSQRVTLTLTLAQSSARQAKLAQFLTDLTTSSSPNYRKWITPTVFAANYGAAPDQIAAATAWAASQQLTVDSISPSGTRIILSGFPAAIQNAFAVSLHTYKLGTATYFAPSSQPSLPAGAAALFSAVDGLDNLSASSPLTSNGIPATFASLAENIDANTTPILSLTTATPDEAISPLQLTEYSLLFKQAAAQGITTISAHAFPSTFPEATALALPGDLPDIAISTVPHPAWQFAKRLPLDNLRHTPDLTASSASALVATLTSIAASIDGKRLGNINPVLYQLALEPGLYQQPGDAPLDTWEPATGLGLVDLAKLAKAFPRTAGDTAVSISLTPGTYSYIYGAPITFTSTVTSTVGGATPTGSISFVVSTGAILGPIALVNGAASYTTSGTDIDAGTYTVQAQYTPDSTYSPASSGSPQFFIAASRTDLTAAPIASVAVGSNFTVVVTGTSHAQVGLPTNNVVLAISGTSYSSTAPLVAAGADYGTATFTVPATTVGTLTFSISCVGTQDFACPNVLTTNATVTKSTPAISITYTPNPPVSGGTITLNATVTGVTNAPVPTGSVTFYDGTTVLQSANLQSGAITEQGIVPSTSTHTITATYNGDANYTPVTSSATPASTVATLAASLSASSAAPSTTINLSGSVTLTGNGAPSGTITATLNYPAGSTTTLSGALVASGSSTALFSIPVTVPATAGAYQLSVGCTSTNAFTCNTVNLPLTSTSATGTTPTSTIVTSSSYSVVYGSAFTVTALVTPSTTVGTSIPSGSFSFSLSDGTVLGSTPVSSNGKGSLLITAPIAAGNYTLLAAYSGDAVYAPSSGSASSTITVTPAAATISATANPITVAVGSSTTISATVTIPGSSVPPTGSVTVTVPGVTGASYTGTLIQTGTNAASVNIAVPAPPAGTYLLQVACAASANFTCMPATVSLTSTAAKIATTTTLTLTPAVPVSGQTVTLTATVTTATTGTSAISGTVSFYNGTTLIGTGAIASGVAKITAILTATTSTQSLTAVYSGDTLYATSTSPAVAVLSLAPTTIVLTATPGSGVAGNNITLTAVVSGTVSSGASPTGTVSFYLASSNPSLLGTAALTSSGSGLASATLNTSSIPASAASVYAVYSGDTLFAPSTSAVVSIGLTDYSLSFSPQSITLAAGDTGNVTLQINAAGGFVGNIAVTCTPPANTLITCSLANATFVGAGSTTLTIVTSAPHLKAQSDRQPGKIATAFSLAALLCFLAPIATRRRLKALRLSAILLAFCALSFTSILGCNSSIYAVTGSNGGTTLGTFNLTIDTAATSGSQSVHHDYTYQVTVQ